MEHSFLQQTADKPSGRKKILDLLVTTDQHFLWGGKFKVLCYLQSSHVCKSWLYSVLPADSVCYKTKSHWQSSADPITLPFTVLNGTARIYQPNDEEKGELILEEIHSKSELVRGWEPRKWILFLCRSSRGHREVLRGQANCDLIIKPETYRE